MQALIQEFRRGGGGGGGGGRVVKGGGAGGGCAPSRAKCGSIFTGGRYLMHEKVFSLGQVHSSYRIFH